MARGSKFWEALQLEDPETQEAMLKAQLIMMPPARQEELKMMEYYLTFKKLPREGGILDQPADELDMLLMGKRRYDICNAIFELRAEQVRKMNEATELMRGRS